MFVNKISYLPIIAAIWASRAGIPEWQTTIWNDLILFENVIPKAVEILFHNLSKKQLEHPLHHLSAAAWQHDVHGIRRSVNSTRPPRSINKWVLRAESILRLFFRRWGRNLIRSSAPFRDGQSVVCPHRTSVCPAVEREKIFLDDGMALRKGEKKPGNRSLFKPFCVFYFVEY